MDKKYQVFLSSTYKDLTVEREKVTQALLELDCIPVGMELFPAADDDQWTLIKNLIIDCDYYILIIAGRYGSPGPKGISYTQMEYEYALSKKIPIISFLHKNPGQIISDKTDQNPELKKKLEDFKALVQKKMCKYWDSPSELSSQISTSLPKLIKSNPRPGWLRATFLPSEDATKQIEELKKHVEQINIERQNEINTYKQKLKDLNEENEFLIAEVERISNLNKTKPKVGDNDILNSLSPDSKELLIEASKSNNARIFKIMTASGLSLQANDKNFDKEGTIRSHAHWEDIINQLLKFGLIKDTSFKKTVFELTKKGFEIADLIQAKEN